MDTFTLVLTSGIGIFVVVLASVLIVTHRKSEEKFKGSLAAALGPDADWDEQKKTFRLQGMNYRYQRHPGSKNTPPSFSVFLECSVTGGEFEIATEGATARFFKKIGITQEVQTGDEVFDKRCFIASDTPVFAKECFASQGRREVVKRFLDMKVQKIVYRGNTLSLTWRGHESHTEGASNLKEAVGWMAALVQGLPMHREIVSLAGSGGGGPLVRNLVIVIAGVVSAAGFLSMLWTNMTYPLFDSWAMVLFSLKFSVPALAVFLVFSFKVLSGHSRSHRNLLMAGGFAITGFLFLGYGATGLYNGMADTSEQVSHVVTIQSKKVTRSKNSRTYRFFVRSWIPGRSVEDLKTRRDVYDRVVPGQYEANVHTRAGKLGFEWMVGYQVRQKPTTSPGTV